MYNRNPLISNHLPPLLRDALVRAAAIDYPDVPYGCSEARTRAVQQTIQRLKLHYPRFFQEN